MARDPSTLPAWIPTLARRVYIDGAIYHDDALEQVLIRLYHAGNLEAVWGRFQEAIVQTYARYSNPWPYLVGGLVLAAGRVPHGRATRDRPDQKIRTLDNQAKANDLMQQIAGQACELAASLRALKALGGVEVPVEMASSLDWINTHLAGAGGASCREEWETFEDSLSSRQVMDFPAPADLLEALAKAAEGLPMGVFKGNPWLRSSNSSWCDFIRMVKEGLFSELERNHGCRIVLQPAEWAKLARAMIDKDIGLEKVITCLHRIDAGT